jgi:predicted PurR-regulated permease PerM
MNVPETRRRESDPADGRHENALRDTGAIGGVVLTVAAITVFLYLIKPILLPFVVAGIIAYVCTPLLNWLAQWTRLPRPLFAVLLFLLLLGLAGFIAAVAGQRLIAETGSTLRDLQGTLGHLLRRRADPDIRAIAGRR